MPLEAAIAAFGAQAKTKLTNPAAKGQPEDQIRAPFEHLLSEVAELCQFPKESVTPVGESSVSDLKTRPDYAVTVHNALVGFIELKAPAKAPTRENSKTLTTRRSGRGFSRCPTSSMRTATPLASGRTVRSLVQS